MARARRVLVVYLTPAQRDALLVAAHSLQTDLAEQTGTRPERMALENALAALRLAQPMTKKE